MEKKALVPFFLICLALLSGTSSWEGVAVAGASSDFARDGLQASSTVFPEGRQVEVTSLSDGVTLRLLIVPDISKTGREYFLLLAPAAASVLGMKQGSEIRISVTLVDESYRIPDFVPGMAESPDPDFNMKLLAIHEKDGTPSPSVRDGGSSPLAQLQGGIFLVEKTGKIISSDATSNPVPEAMKASSLSIGKHSTATTSSSYTQATIPGRFLQVGAFATAKAMNAAMHRFLPFYQMDVRPFLLKGRLHYRLLVGPLSPKDMEGARARARTAGIRDAFQTD